MRYADPARHAWRSGAAGPRRDRPRRLLVPPLPALRRADAAILDLVSSKPPTTAATTALARLGIPFTAHPYRHDPASPSYGEEAAAALGLRSEQVFKTLIAAVDGALVTAVVPVASRLDLGALA